MRERKKNGSKRGEGDDLMLTWWALGRDFVGQICELIHIASNGKGPNVRQCFEALVCKEKLCRLYRKLSPENFKKGLLWLKRII